MPPSSRERMLATIRQGLAKNRAVLQAEAALVDHTPPPFVHPAQDDVVAQFAGEVERLESRAYRCADDEEALEVIQGLLQQNAAQQVIAWDLEQIGLPGLDALLRQEGVEMLDGQVVGASEGRAARLQALGAAEVCISGVDAAIAESGTLVLRSDAGRPRLASLLAPTYIAVVRASQIARGLGEALARLQEQHGDDPLAASSSITFVTGPSRTGDIEQTLTLGVHGPRDVHVVIIDVP